MPEIAEVARCVHFIRKHLLNKTLAKVHAQPDEIVYGKVGTTAQEVEKHLTGKKVVDVGQQGKYFWMIMSSPPHPVMHFGMSGWFAFKGDHTYYYKPKAGEENLAWPPKSWKFRVETDGKGADKVEGAFVDQRRLGRVRLVDCPGTEIRSYSPLKENGPDPVIDQKLVSVEWLTDKCRKKKVPIKAMLLDQANISGIGNWVGDEVMYHARIHPEQYANTLTDEQIKQLHHSIHYICTTAVDLLADSDRFPEDWLFKHRWGKGKKNADHQLPNGERIVFLTVGGRTSAVVPSRQKKTGPVAGDVEDAPQKPSMKRKVEEEDDENHEEKKEVTRPAKSTARSKKTDAKDTVMNGTQSTSDAQNAESAPEKVFKGEKSSKTTKSMSMGNQPSAKKSKVTSSAAEKAKVIENTGRRRSGRNKA